MPLAGDANKLSTIFSGADRLGFFDVFGKDPSKWPQAAQEGLGYGFGMKLMQQTPKEEAASLKAKTEAQQEMLRFSQELGKESIKTAREEMNKYRNQQALRESLSRLPGQIASIFNPLADPATAALVLGTRQRGFEGQEAILRSIPGLQPATFAMPNRSYFG